MTNKRDYFAVPACTEIGFPEARRSEEQPAGPLTARSPSLPLTIHGEDGTVGAEPTQGIYFCLSMPIIITDSRLRRRRTQHRDFERQRTCSCYGCVE